MTDLGGFVWVTEMYYSDGERRWDERHLQWSSGFLSLVLFWFCGFSKNVTFLGLPPLLAAGPAVSLLVGGLGS